MIFLESYSAGIENIGLGQSPSKILHHFQSSRSNFSLLFKVLIEHKFDIVPLFLVHDHIYIHIFIYLNVFLFKIFGSSRDGSVGKVQARGMADEP